MFAKLHGKKQRPISSINSQTPRTSNTTHANSISLSSGNLIVGSNRNLRQKKEQFGSQQRASGRNLISNKENDDNVNNGGDNNYDNGERVHRHHIPGLKIKAYQAELGYHESRFSENLVMLNLVEFPDIKPGDLVELKTYHKNPSASNGDKKIYFIAKDFDGETKRRAKTSNVSILSGQLQTLLDLPSRSRIWIKLKPNKFDLQADVVEFNIKDCLLNRGDMWVLSSKLVDTCVFTDQRLAFLDSIRGTIKGIYRNGKKIVSGYIGEQTRIIFRSESARLIFLIQITDEMWNFEETGEQLFQKMVNSFFPKIFKKWKDVDTHHTITIAFAISMDLSDTSFKDLTPGESLKNSQDYFRIVVDQVSIIHWVDIMETLREEFMEIRKDLLNKQTDKGYSVANGRFSPVIKSNFLELVNFATTILTDPFKQLDLRHTTTHVMIISPGSGLFDVDYSLLRLTGKKLLSLEMTMDLICLSKAPLHIVPLFRYRDFENKLHHCVPLWLSVFFWNDHDKKSNSEWTPRCKIYDLQMMGITENELIREVDVEYLQLNKKVKSLSEFMNDYDKNAFEVKILCAGSNTKQFKKLNSKFDTVFENDVVVKARKIPATATTTHGNTKFIWRGPKVAIPAIKDIQKPNVIPDLSIKTIEASFYDDCNTTNDKISTPTTSNNDNLEMNDSLVSVRSADNQNTSLALDSLKGLSKRNSLKDFTQRVITKFISNIDTSKNKEIKSTLLRDDVDNSPLGSNTPLPSSESKISGLKLQQKGLTDENVISKRGNLIIKKNLSIFGLPSNEIMSGSPSSYLGSSHTRTSSKLSNMSDKAAFITEGQKSKHDDSNTYSLTQQLKHRISETWVDIKSPSIPVSSEFANELLPIRWKDVWPKYVARKYSKWRSFTTPAELPITISDFPSKDDFDRNFIFRNHSVTLNTDQEQYNQTYKDLLRDMIYMRLLTGFQICVGRQVEKIELSRESGESETVVNKYLDFNQNDAFKLYLMIDSEIHRITCSSSGIIDVERYLRKDETNLFDQVPSYIPLVKTRYESSFRDAMIDPLHVKRESLNWNQIDQVLAGYGDNLIDRKWHGFRAKYVVLPTDIPPNTYSMVINGKSETLNPEEIRVEGLRRLIGSITRSRLRTEKEKKGRKTKREEIQPEVMFYTGPLYNFINEQQTSLESSAINFKDSIFVNDNNLLNRNVELSKLAYQIQRGEDRITLVNRKWHWKKHEKCFVGSEMVNWLIRNFSDIDTREDAIKYGQKVMKEGLFVHVLNKHNFLDGHYFYQFSPEYVMDTNKLEKTNSHRSTLSDPKQMLRKASTGSSNDPSAMTPFSSVVPAISASNASVADAKEPSRPILMLSNSLVIDVDPAGKSSKQESCTVHYDRVHNPDHCFHIRLEWLTTTPKLIDDLVGNWSRLCERYGLKMIEIPWEELCTIPSVNPFHSFVEIKLAINPWEDPEFKDRELFAKSKFYYHVYLLKASGFLLDNRASKFLQNQDIEFDIMYSWGKPQFKYVQYIHHTGAYVAELRENGCLFLAPNNIYISRVNPGNIIGKIHSASSSSLDAQKVILNFKSTCLDYQKLRSIFLDAKEMWITGKIVED
ncbi:BAG_1a_G0030510.mRNA.1.CDS.1 [Saccharomyces cerevisiae]|nr:SX2_G0009010.mRNA.1.CDS.1 [Saccharomyces cerevisiae]CAI4852693.1 BAG_1a_G0030510.mRNA.1.CDS.1 [Saccharomyces cerevisiae]CAI7390678.1 BAG_1a_G0030510.mRNA.1.CDS.1 [Saccharomyces cerevisiae]